MKQKSMETKEIFKPTIVVGDFNTLPSVIDRVGRQIDQREYKIWTLVTNLPKLTLTERSPHHLWIRILVVCMQNNEQDRAHAVNQFQNTEILYMFSHTEKEL